MSENSPPGRLRTVLDTNLFISSLIRSGGAPDRIVGAWEGGAFLLLTTLELIAEFVDVSSRQSFLTRYRPSQSRIATFLRGFAAAEQVTPLVDLPIHCRDPKDDNLLACALGGGADVLVTGDRDLLVLDGEPALGKLRVLSPEDFLALIAERTA